MFYIPISIALSYIYIIVCLKIVIAQSAKCNIMHLRSRLFSSNENLFSFLQEKVVRVRTNAGFTLQPDVKFFL